MASLPGAPLSAFLIFGPLSSAHVFESKSSHSFLLCIPEKENEDSHGHEISSSHPRFSSSSPAVSWPSRRQSQAGDDSVLSWFWGIQRVLCHGSIPSCRSWFSCRWR